jgi:V/A-type H+-transporting ATPase subunit I
MIAEMAQVLILGRKRDSLEVVRALQDAGVVQIDPIDAGELPKGTVQGPEAERRAGLERQLARAESALAAMGATRTLPDFSKLKGISSLESYLEEIGHRTDVIASERTELEAEVGAINSYGKVARALAELAGTLDRSERVATFGFTFVTPDELAKLEKSLADANLIYTLGHKVIGLAPGDSLSAGVLAVRKEDFTAARTALTRSGLSELRFPGRFEGLPFSQAASRMDERSRIAPEALQGMNAELDKLRRDHAGTLSASRVELRDELARYTTLESSVAGKYGFALRGWLPISSKPALEGALAPLKGQIIYQFEAPDHHHTDNVPVKLENNAIVKPFELLMGIFAPPAYGHFDPTWVIALCFPIFFGFVIGDIGLGLISLGVAFLLRGMANRGQTLEIGFLGVIVPPKPLLNVATILTHMSVWSIIFGFLYGEFFGTLLEHLHVFYIPGHGEEGKAAYGLIPIILPRLESSATGIMLILALIPGILQILYGWFVRFQSGLAHNDPKHTYEGAGMFIGLVGLIMISYAYRNPGSPQILYIIGGICLAVSVFLNWVMAKLGPMSVIEIISNGGNILSYLRLYAVGLSSAVLAKLATDLGWNLGMQLGVVGILVGIVVASLVHLFAIVFTIIGHVLQPLRLHYAEFFTKFGFYDKSGRPYRPFARLGGVQAQPAER